MAGRGGGGRGRNAISVPEFLTGRYSDYLAPAAKGEGYERGRSRTLLFRRSYRPQPVE